MFFKPDGFRDFRKMIFDVKQAIGAIKGIAVHSSGAPSANEEIHNDSMLLRPCGLRDFSEAGVTAHDRRIPATQIESSAERFAMAHLRAC